MKHRSQLRILLLQARQDQPTQLEELAEFARLGRLRLDQFTVLNGCDTPSFSPDCLQGHDALFVGGSSDVSVLAPARFPFVADAKKLMTYCVDATVPVFSSCFGFQLMVEALGGTVILDSAGMEMGSIAIQLTPTAKSDLLCHDLPEEFLAIAGHKERALTLPPQTLHLAGTELCPYHALKIPEKPIYGFQFHPELDKSALVTRLTRYCDRYLDDTEHLQPILANLQETPEANQLIDKFIQRILLA
jgi:GMP synthase (glutamine-hydrolysing)